MRMRESERLIETGREKDSQGEREQETERKRGRRNWSSQTHCTVRQTEAQQTPSHTIPSSTNKHVCVHSTEPTHIYAYKQDRLV